MGGCSGGILFSRFTGMAVSESGIEHVNAETRAAIGTDCRGECREAVEAPRTANGRGRYPAASVAADGAIMTVLREVKQAAHDGGSRRGARRRDPCGCGEGLAWQLENACDVAQRRSFGIR